VCIQTYQVQSKKNLVSVNRSDTSNEGNGILIVGVDCGVFIEIKKRRHQVILQPNHRLLVLCKAYLLLRRAQPRPALFFSQRGEKCRTTIGYPRYPVPWIYTFPSPLYACSIYPNGVHVLIRASDGKPFSNLRRDSETRVPSRIEILSSPEIYDF
jgi:hypothetical protein